MTDRAAEPSLRDAASEARQWLFEAAAPRWSDMGAGPAPLFPERLSLAGHRDPCPHRLFVQARHIFAFCEIGRLGWDGPWRDLVIRATKTLLEAGRRSDGFFVHTIDAAGRVIDPRADLYDQAFMLLALAHAGQALGEPRLFDEARALDSLLEAHWRLPHGGYFEGEIAVCPPFRQNPHMHLLESFIALHLASGEALWRERAEEIAALCSVHFIDPASGALLEYFDERLRPAPGREGRMVEPGHCFEWAWLFERLALWGVAGATSISDGLVRLARTAGIDPSRGVAINEVLADGAPVNASARLWPQTERLKAALARHRRTGETAEIEESLAAYRGLVRYFETPAAGVWRDKLGADGAWVEEPAPGSSLYHIVCALAELLDSAGAA